MRHYSTAKMVANNEELKSFSESATSSSCRATSMDLPDLLLPPISIIHHSWEVFKATSCISTKLLYIGSCQSFYLCSSIKQKYMFCFLASKVLLTSIITGGGIKSNFIFKELYFKVYFMYISKDYLWLHSILVLLLYLISYTHLNTRIPIYHYFTIFKFFISVITGGFLWSLNDRKSSQLSRTLL